MMSYRDRSDVKKVFQKLWTRDSLVSEKAHTMSPFNQRRESRCDSK